MRSNQSSDNESRGRSRAGKRQRRFGLALVVGVFIFVVAAFAPSASAQTSDSSDSTSSSSSSSSSELSHLPQGVQSFTMTCEGADDATKALLSNPLVGIPTFPITAEITNLPVEPAPKNGEQFQMSFIWKFTQSADLVSTAAGLGVTDFNLTNSVDTMNAVSGATGSSVGTVDSQDVSLGDGTQPVSYLQPPTGSFPGTFTRTNDEGQPITFAPGDITVTVTPNPLTTALNLVCHPPDGVVLSLTDVAGAAPPPVVPVTPPTATGTNPAAATTTPAGPTVEATSTLARTGGFHAELLYIGIAMLAFGYALSLTGRRFARQASRSD